MSSGHVDCFCSESVMDRTGRERREVVWVVWVRGWKWLVWMKSGDQRILDSCIEYASLAKLECWGRPGRKAGYDFGVSSRLGRSWMKSGAPLQCRQGSPHQAGALVVG